MTLGFLWISPNLHWRCTSNREQGSCHEEVSGSHYLRPIDYYSKLENRIFIEWKGEDHPTAPFWIQNLSNLLMNFLSILLSLATYFFKKNISEFWFFGVYFFLIILFVVVVLVVCLFVFSQNSTSAERHQFLLFHSPMLFQDYSSTRVCVL